MLDTPVLIFRSIFATLIKLNIDLGWMAELYATLYIAIYAVYSVKRKGEKKSSTMWHCSFTSSLHF